MWRGQSKRGVPAVTLISVHQGERLTVLYGRGSLFLPRLSVDKDGATTLMPDLCCDCFEQDELAIVRKVCWFFVATRALMILVHAEVIPEEVHNSHTIRSLRGMIYTVLLTTAANMVVRPQTEKGTRRQHSRCVRLKNCNSLHSVFQMQWRVGALLC